MSDNEAMMRQVKRERETEKRVRDMDAADLVALIHDLEDRLDAAEAERDSLKVNAAELEELFQQRWRADMRAIKQWQAAHEGKELTWPDHVDLVMWLAEQRDAALVALDAAERTEHQSEAEQERDELFNRLGRVTSELGLSMDCTTGRIIEAIDERVDAEREACASVSVRVEVPGGAEAWTPLEAWEEALVAMDEAFREAIRNRAAAPRAGTEGGA